MTQTILVLLGVLMAVVIVGVSYPTYLYISLKIHEKKVKEVYVQIKAQVDIKCDLLSNIKDANKEVDSVILEYTRDKKERYDLDLKYYNEIFNKYIYAYADKECIFKCNDSEEKIEYIKGYYNEVVHTYNRLKSNVVTSYLSKCFLIDDAKLY
jgi:hypothetical protein